MENQDKNQIEKVAGQQTVLFIPDTESLGMLKALNPSFSLTTKYKNADEWAALKDKPVRCYYMGIKEVPNEEGEVIACGMFVSQSEFFLSGQKILVDAVRNLPSHTPIQITYRGKKSNKTSEGSTMMFDVEKLA